jgi:hypothetical protein
MVTGYLGLTHNKNKLLQPNFEMNFKQKIMVKKFISYWLRIKKRYTRIQNYIIITGLNN